MRGGVRLRLLTLTMMRGMVCGGLLRLEGKIPSFERARWYKWYRWYRWFRCSGANGTNGAFNPYFCTILHTASPIINAQIFAYMILDIVGTFEIITVCS